MPKFCPIERKGATQRLRAPMMSRSGSSALLPSKHWGGRSLSSPSYRIEERRQRGFTLLELLVVLAILGLLIGLVGPRVMHQFGSAKEKDAQLSIGRVATALDMDKLDVGTHPTAEQRLQGLVTRPSGVASWRGPCMAGEKVPEDPWGRPFVYHNPSQRAGHEFDLYSLGPAGQATSSASSTVILNE